MYTLVNLQKNLLTAVNKRFPEMAVFSFDDTGLNPLIKVTNFYPKNK